MSRTLPAILTLACLALSQAAPPAFAQNPLPSLNDPGMEPENGGGAPLSLLKDAGDFISDLKPELQSPPYKKAFKVMEKLTHWDNLADNILANAHAEEGSSRSLLILGEEDMGMDYVLARAALVDRLALQSNPEWKANHFVKLNLLAMAGNNPGIVHSDFEHFQKKIIKPIKDLKGQVVLYLPNVQAFLGLGAHMNNANGMDQNVRDFIQSGELMVVGLISPTVYNANINKPLHAPFLKSFSAVVTLEPPPATATLDILKAVTGVEEKPSFTVEEPTLQDLIFQTDAYQPAKNQPGKSLEVLQYLFKARKQKLFREVLDRQRTGGGPTPVSTIPLSFAEMREAIGGFLHLPEWVLKEDFTLVNNLQASLDKKVVECKEAKDALIKNAYNAFYGYGELNHEHTLGSHMFVGPTGTGKTFISKQFAKALQLQYVVFDMTQYAMPHQGPTFSARLRQSLLSYPMGVYVFEELDKAYIDIRNSLYFLLDEGIYIDEEQLHTSGRKSFFIITTNDGWDIVVANPTHRYDERLRAEVLNRLMATNRASFLGRLSSIDIFYPFQGEEWTKLATSILSDAVEEIQIQGGPEVAVTPLVLKMIAEGGRSAVFGARPMEKYIVEVVGYPISMFAKEYGRNALKGAKLTIDWDPSAKEIKVSDATFGRVLSVAVSPDTLWKLLGDVFPLVSARPQG